MEYKYRHGDVDFFAKATLPKEAEKKKGTTVALGEVTNHHHTLYKLSEDTKIELFEHVNNLITEQYVKITGGKAALKHQEHEVIVLEPDTYKVQIETELDPFAEQLRKVID